MTLSQLEDKLKSLRTSGYGDDTPITVCDLSDDSDENYHFRSVKEVDTIQVKKKYIVALIIES